MKNLFVLISLLFILWNNAFGQLPDSTRAYNYLNLFREYEYVDTIKAAIYADSALYLAEKCGKPAIMGSAYMYTGWHLQDQSKFREALVFFEKSLKYFQKAKDKQGIADAYGNLGNAYLDIDNLKQSLEYQVLSLKANDQILASKPVGDRFERAEEGRSYALHNIGALYLEIGLFEKALEYERLSILHEIRHHHIIGEAVSYSTMGVIHNELKNRDSAIYYFKKALKIFKENPSDYERSSTLHRYALMDDSGLTEAQRSKMIKEALQLRMSLGDRKGEAEILIDWSLLKFSELSNDSIARVLKKVDHYIMNYDLDSRLETYYFLLSKYKARTGDFNTAYQAVMEYLDHKGSAEKRKRANELVAGEINYQWQQKSYQDSIKKAMELHDAEMNKKLEVTRLQNYLWVSVLGIFIISFSLYYYVRSNRKKKRMNDLLFEKNELISEQKLVLEETNQSVAESIRYAERLQKAILPTTSLVNRYLPDSFLIFQPRDVVSGDFYWFETKGDFLFLGVADCTGHGVPGALVSVVCSNALNRSLHEFGLIQPAEILNKTRELVVETFSKSGANVDDGMDISLVRYSKKIGTAVFSGANNPLWIVRKNGSTEAELFEYRGDRMPVGHYPEEKSFTECEIKLKKGDMLYQMSDGYADQFGEESGKRLKSTILKKELINISMNSLEEQKTYLTDRFSNWKGKEDQVDDVTMIGYRI